MTHSTSVGIGGRVSAAVRVNGELCSAPTDLPPDTVFPIYSITKTLTAICVLRLIEAGTLRFADAARRWLPDVDIPATITLTHLLRHTSGLRDYGPLAEYHQAVRTHPDKPWTRQQFLEAVPPKAVLFAPGESFSYSNVGYMLLIDIVERVTGQTFARVLKDVVATPLALERTRVLAQIDDLMRCIPGFGSEVTSDGHIVDVRGRYHPGWCAPRLVASTAVDITRVCDALIAGDRASPWGRNYHHGGGGPGYDLGATVYPETPLGRVSIAVFVNSSCGPRARDCEATVLAQLFDEKF